MGQTQTQNYVSSSSTRAEMKKFVTKQAQIEDENNTCYVVVCIWCIPTGIWGKKLCIPEHDACVSSKKDFYILLQAEWKREREWNAFPYEEDLLFRLSKDITACTK